MSPATASFFIGKYAVECDKENAPPDKYAAAMKDIAEAVGPSASDPRTSALDFEFRLNADGETYTLNRNTWSMDFKLGEENELNWGSLKVIQSPRHAQRKSMTY